MRLVVMENVIRSDIGDEHLLGIFDLKGSRSDRLVEGSAIGQITTLKDQNLINLHQ